ncbi:NADP-dependent oxidoreductase [Aeromicrobium fastidiosum]|uniref:NADP-dependent oxidoreductase n=1 Tax=Aeromicrobium fastidiosum TaxID=52699 RepID=A0A641APB7_9ACTN|nr:NADP-dependent oxidoreductase [Aeromicrobium fastidiosum]KAA1378237.1 NADP-dependent oxidoreductase [Aeromicrobium fastidiosum]MBP2388948.1 NADPH:quinone reductase-like Zn-dependent oxidoreductase [Aeromicrobium fastidiosum]
MTALHARRWAAHELGGPDVWRLDDHEVPAPGPGEVTIEVRAAGMNPADVKHVAAGTDASRLPVAIGYEVAGVVSAVGPGTRIATGPVEVGDEVLAFRIAGGYATAVTVRASDVFAKPARLGFAEAANLLLAGTTALDMLRAAHVVAGDTILLHGASGAVGVSVLQQARLLGVTVVGTASPGRFDVVGRFGGVPVAHGDGLEERVRDAVPGGLDAALDAAGADEAVDVSLALVADRGRIVTIAAKPRAQRDGFTALAGSNPDSARYRDSVRARLVELAGSGELVVPVARTYALDDARAAAAELMGGHPGGKLALVP